MAIPRDRIEIAALDNFRPLVSDLQLQDGLLMRFLRARQLDTAKAEDMLRKFVVWRVTAKCNQFLGFRTPLEFFKIECFLTGFDNEDRPVFWAPLANWPIFRDMMDLGLEEDFLKWAGKLMDKIHQLLLLTKHQQFIGLADSDGVTFSKMFYEAKSMKGFRTLMGLMNDYEKNFPELLHKAIMFNTPWAFMWGWKILSHCFAPYTLSKIQFHGTEKRGQKEWKAAIFDSLPERCIPPEYGGTATLTDINKNLILAWERHCLSKEKRNGKELDEINTINHNINNLNIK